MKTEGIEEPTAAQRQRFDRKRKKSLSNRDWVNPHDREARITKMKDGRTHLAYKAEHAVDLETGAVVALTVQPGDCGETASRRATVSEAGCTVTEMAGQAAQADAVGPVETVSEVGVERVVADKGYHSKQALQDLAEVGVRTVISEPERKRQKWAGQSAAQAAVYANRRRLDTKSAKALMRRRGELIERSFAHLYDTGGMRRVHLRGKNNIAKRVLIHAAAFNLSLLLRRMIGVGTARQAADLIAALCFAFLKLTRAGYGTLPAIEPRRPTTRPGPRYAVPGDRRRSQFLAGAASRQNPRRSGWAGYTPASSVRTRSRLDRYRFHTKCHNRAGFSRSPRLRPVQEHLPSGRHRIKADCDHRKRRPFLAAVDEQVHVLKE